MPLESLSLLETLKQRVIPLILERGARELVVAHSHFHEFPHDEDLPEGMRISHKPLQSHRVAVKGRRLFGRAALVEATWAKDGLHAIRTPKLCFVIAGAVAFQVGDTVIHCNPRQALLIPPGIAHPDGSHNYLDDTRMHDGSCDLLMMMPYVDGVECWLSHTRDGHHWSHSTTRECARFLHPKLPFYFEELLAEATTPWPYASPLRDSLLITLMLLTLREAEKMEEMGTLNEIDNWNNTEVADHKSPIDRAEEYIHQHLNEKLTIDKVAHHVYLSRSRFTQLFRSKTGKSFNAYLCDCRFEAAKALLCDDSNWPIERISDFVGLGAGRLRSLFHQRLGMAPTQFRESLTVRTKISH